MNKIERQKSIQIEMVNDRRVNVIMEKINLSIMEEYLISAVFSLPIFKN